MKRISVFALIAAFTPFVASYGGGSSPSADQQQHNYLSSNSESIIEEDVISENRSNQEPSNTYGDAASGSASSLNQANAQLQDLNANPTYENMKNSEAIAESLAENILASNMRQGKIDIVAPNVITQAAFRSLMIPKAFNNHQVIATQPLQPIVVTQPGVPPAQISSGPPAVVKASPVVYKLKPSVIYQQEIINKIPTPLSLNPVYVKVYKPGKQVNVPMVPARATAPSPQYDQNRYAHDTITNNYASSAPYMHGMSSKY